VANCLDWGIDNSFFVWYDYIKKLSNTRKTTTMSKRTPLSATRVNAGRYVYGGYIIERMYDWNTCKPDGRWTFRSEDGYPNDYYWSKREALEALDEHIISSNAEK